MVLILNCFHFMLYDSSLINVRYSFILLEDRYKQRIFA